MTRTSTYSPAEWLRAPTRRVKIALMLANLWFTTEFLVERSSYIMNSTLIGKKIFNLKKCINDKHIKHWFYFSLHPWIGVSINHHHILIIELSAASTYV